MDFVNVAIRIKPSYCENGQSVKVISNDIVFIPEKQISFAYDKIFTDTSSQESIYNDVVQPLVQRVISGYNATIFAYGQTGTGKTYTIGSDLTYCNNGEEGLITRTLNDIMNFDATKIVTTSISFIEIYNERVYDLLSNNKVALLMKGFNITGLSKHLVATPIEAQRLLMEGGKHRHTGETRQNANSSRSHAIFTIYCNVKHLGQETEAKFNLVDLAGSESVKKTGNEGSQFHEGININKGLLYIGQVINALSNNQRYVPYRESTITTILQDSLNTKNYVTLIACISTKLEDLTETVQTLDFAQRVKKVKNKPEINTVITEYMKTQNLNRTPLKSSNRVNTPNKLPMSFRTPFTPHIQKLKRPPILLQQSTSNLFSSDTSTIRSEITSSMSTIHEPPNNFSPIVQKYMEAVNNKLVQQIKDVVTDIITPMINRANIPRISKRSLVREVNEIVHSKMKLEDFDEFQSKMMNSCYIDSNSENKSYEHINGGICTAGSSPITSGNKTPMFKKPKAVLVRQKKGQTLFAASSPIQNSPPSTNVRRSKRISVRNPITASHNFTPLPISCRRSKRISTINLESKEKLVTPMKPKERKKQEKRKKSLKRLSPKGLTDQSRTKKIIAMINNGTVKDLTDLQTIGPKSAAMIYQFRQIKGQIRKISELTEMPWRGTAYQRFVLTNFLEPETP